MIVPRLGCLSAFAILLGSHAAVAQEALGAEVMFDEGVRLMKAGQFADACPKIAESQRLEPRAGTLFTLAECLANEGKIATALARYEEYLRLHSRMSDDERAKQRGRDKVAETKRDELRPQIPQIKLALPANAPAGTRVLKGEIELGSASLGVWLPVDPGEQVIVVETADGRREKRQSVGVGQKLEIQLELPTPKGASAGDGASTSGSDVAPKSSSKKTLGYVALGVGGVGMVVSAVTGFLVFSKKSTIDDHCGQNGAPDTQCDSEGKRAADSAKTLALISTVGFGVGVIGLGAGTYFLMSAGGDAGNRSATVGLRGTW